MRRALLGWASLALVCSCFSKYNAEVDGGTFANDGGTFTPDGESSEGGEQATGTLSATSIDFGLVSCGTAPTAKTLSVQNTGTVPATWSATVDSIYSIQGASSGTVPPGGTGSLTLTTSMVPTTSDPGVVIAGTLTITTDIAGLASVGVPVTLTPQGGSLYVTPTISGFGTVQIGTQGGPLPVDIQNLGNAPVHVTFGTPTDPTFSATYAGAPAAVAIAPNTSLAGASVSFTPTASAAKTATVAIQTTDPLCASTSTSISLSGAGTTAPVSIGPSPLDFGNVPCGMTGTAQTVTIKSGYTAPITFTATLAGNPSPYSLSIASGSVPAKSTTTITVTPAAIPFPANPASGAYDDTLTITTSAPNAPTVAIPLTQVLAGAILSLSAPSTSFGTVSATGTLPFTVTNLGGIAAPLTIVATGPGFGGTVSGTGIAAAGGTAPATATFAPQSNMAASGTLSVTTTAALCAPLPDGLTFTGTGAIPIATFPGTTLMVETPCAGKPPPTTATLSIENTGVAPLQLFNPASKNGDFTVVSFTTTTIAPGGTGTIEIQAHLPPTGACPCGAQQLQDTLTFQTNEPGSPTDSVGVVNTTVRGC